MTPNDRDWLQGQLDSLGNTLSERLEGHLHSLKTELSEKILDTETKLLTAFYKWASPVDIKLRGIPAIEERLQLLEERVRDIEMGRNRPQ